MTEKAFSGNDTREYAAVFDNVLERGEKLLWTGRPRQNTLMPMDLRSTLLMGTAAVFCLMFAFLAYLLAPALLYKIIGVGAGLIFCLLSVYTMFNHVGGGLLARKKAYYALTDRRALALFQGRYPALVSKEYGDSRDVKLRMSKNGRGTIVFGEGTMTYVGMEHVRGSTRPLELRFVDVENAYAVYDKVCELNPEYRASAVA